MRQQKMANLRQSSFWQVDSKTKVADQECVGEAGRTECICRGRRQ